LFLIDREGKIPGQFEPGDALTAEIEKALAGGQAPAR
jgi:hypothetical protein